MADWLSYSITDFLPFTQETFLRLAERYNLRFGLAVIVGGFSGILSLWLLWQPRRWRQRVVLAAFGASWLWISWAYQIEMLAPLLWAAELFALAFALQSGLLLAAAALMYPEPAPRLVTDRLGPGRWLGYGMLTFAVLVLPLVELAAGRAWSMVALFGTAPDTTAIGTLGLAALMAPRLRLLLMPVPILWCLISAVLRLGLIDPLWLVPGLAAVVGIIVIGLDAWTRRTHRQ
ncbi:DUF6064 family protein [Halochromatium glycolicum]|uniref:MFS transporter permease n=1 Tax=Halochromatium glycolicum TaxID=85075 RepID=A0AAJ0U777_9GAMM|nr:DUF6064 family protein [Halochromatium glycolicum]MBK1706584.1 hypothetical protein [Halochromatium glycolicum]